MGKIIMEERLRKKILIILGIVIVVLITGLILFLIMDNKRLSTNTNVGEHTNASTTNEKKLKEKQIKDIFSGTSEDVDTAIIEEDLTVDKDNDQKFKNEDFSKYTEIEYNNKINELMLNKSYNKYAMELINEICPELSKKIGREKVYKIISTINTVVINPYNPATPNLSSTDRAYNTGSSIVINTFKGELENESNRSGLKWLLTHEMTHSLGDFEVENPARYLGHRNALIEEGVADLLGDYIKNQKISKSFGIILSEDFNMYDVKNNFNINHTYTIGANIVKQFEALGCFNEVVDANYTGSWNSLKQCVNANVPNGDKEFGILLEKISDLFYYMGYPNSFISQKELIAIGIFDKKEVDFIKKHTLNNLLLDYSKKASQMFVAKYEKYLADNGRSSVAIAKTKEALKDYKANVAIYWTNSNPNSFSNSILVDFEKKL